MIQIALSQYGIKETPGKADNPEVLKYFDEIGFNGSQLKDETAWCSAFMNWVAKKSGRKYSGKLNAKSWLEIGTRTAIPQIGDVVVLQRGPIGSWKGHVGLFIRETATQIYMLGGNQGNRVCIAPYAKSRLLQYRRL